jgi:hypothetical protein
MIIINIIIIATLPLILVSTPEELCWDSSCCSSPASLLLLLLFNKVIEKERRIDQIIMNN